MYLELQRTDRVRHALKIIGLTMRKIVHRVHIPTTSSTVMRVGGDDTVHDRIAEVHVRIRHVDLGAENHLSFLDLTALHGLKETQVLFDRTVTER